VDVSPILKVFDALMTAGATLGLGAAGLFVMLAGYQYMSAGGSVRAIESAKGSLYNALIGFSIVILCKVIAGLIGGALGAPVPAARPEGRMTRVYELPTHLQVEDQLIAGLTARQLVRLMVGASLAYGTWDQATWLADDVRFAVALVLAAVGVLFALVEPSGQPLDQWLLAGLLFVLLPRRLAWRPGSALVGKLPREQVAWAELELEPAWLDSDRSIDSMPAKRS
jgi:hypothetical protein